MRDTVSSNGILNLLKAADRLGIAREAIVRAAGVSEAAVTGPEHAVPARALEQGWLVLDAQAGEPIAPHLVASSRDEGLSAVGILAAMLASCSDISAFRETARRYGPLTGSMRVPTIDITPEALVYSYPALDSPLGLLPSWNETLALATPMLMQAIGGPHWCATEVQLRHPRGDRKRYEDWFGCKVRLGCSATRVLFARELGEQRFTPREGLLQAYLRQHADALLSLHDPNRPLSVQVSERLPQLLQTGRNVVNEVARELGLSERSLQRHLRSEGTSFAEVLWRTRRRLAESYLEHSSLSVAAIAALLGYRSAAALHLAFRQWTGKTPGEFRARNQPSS